MQDRRFYYYVYCTELQLLVCSFEMFDKGAIVTVSLPVPSLLAQLLLHVTLLKIRYACNTAFGITLHSKFEP